MSASSKFRCLSLIPGICQPISLWTQEESGYMDTEYSSPFQPTEYDPSFDASTTAGRCDVGSYSSHDQVIMTPYPSGHSFLPQHPTLERGNLAQMNHNHYQGLPSMPDFHHTPPMSHYQGHTFVPIGMNELSAHAGGYPQTGASFPYAYDNGYHGLGAYQQLPQNGGEHQVGTYQHFPQNGGEHQVGTYQQSPIIGGEYQAGATMFSPYPGQSQPDADGQLRGINFNTMHARQANSDTNNIGHFPDDGYQNRNEAVRSAGALSQTYPQSSQNTEATLYPNVSNASVQQQHVGDFSVRESIGDPVNQQSDTSVGSRQTISTPHDAISSGHPDPMTIRGKGRTTHLSPEAKAHAKEVREVGACKDCRRNKRKVSNKTESSCRVPHFLI